MTDPSNLDIAFFEPHLETQFQVDGGAISLTLVECKQLKSVPGQLREPFSLLFRGPADVMLPQKLYTLSNDKAGQVDIFLVPVSRDAVGVIYEAVFN